MILIINWNIKIYKKLWMDKLDIYINIWEMNGKIKNIQLYKIRKLLKDIGQGI